MKIIEPSVELWEQKNAIDHVARCARVCYKSEKETGNERLVENLKKSNHLSMFRHESIYAIISKKDVNSILLDILSHFVECPYIDWNTYADDIYIATNGNFMLDLLSRAETDFDSRKLYLAITNHQVDVLQFANTETGFHLMRYTFKITTQISTSRELNRVSPNSISEQSTRYVLEDGSICRPWWLDKEDAKKYNKSDINIPNNVSIYTGTCEYGFIGYRLLFKIGMLREDIRGVLPLDTATVCVYTYSIKEWREILRKRLYHETGKAHKNCVIICKMIRDELNELGYEL